MFLVVFSVLVSFISVPESPCISLLHSILPLAPFQGDVLQQQRVQRQAHPVVAAGQGGGQAEGSERRGRRRLQRQPRQAGREEEQEVGGRGGAQDQARHARLCATHRS